MYILFYYLTSLTIRQKSSFRSPSRTLERGTIYRERRLIFTEWQYRSVG